MVILHRANQGGSIVNFVIVGIILVLAVISVAYVVQKRGEQARKDIAVATVDELTKNSKDSKGDNDSTETAKTSNSETKNPDTDENDTAETPKSSSNLPATGPEQTAAELFIVGLVTFVVASFVLSRSKLARSL